MAGEAPISDADNKKRIRLFEAAEPLFGRYGYRKTTIEEICQAAGASKRTFYELFRNKGDLFGHLLLHICEIHIERWRRDLPDSLDPKARIVSYIDLYAGTLATQPLLRQLFTQDGAAAFGHALGEALQSPIISILAEIIEEGVACGQFRPMDPQAAVWLVSAVLDSMYFLIPEWTNIDGASDNPVLAEETRRFILAGLGCRE
jgi:AcrR family transcriptional regulator